MCRRHPHAAPVVSIKLLDDAGCGATNLTPGNIFFLVKPKCLMAKELLSQWIRQNTNMGLLTRSLKKTIWISTPCVLVNVVILLDTWMPLHKMNGDDMFHFSGFTFDYEQQEKDTRASTDLMPSSIQWLKFQFWINCPFSEMTQVLLHGTTAWF